MKVQKKVFFLDHFVDNHLSLEKMLFEREIISDDKLGEVMAELYGAPFIKVSEKTIPEALLRIIPYTLASHQSIIPFESNGRDLKIAISNPHNLELKVSFLMFINLLK